jgi:hypothetical protein
MASKKVVKECIDRGEELHRLFHSFCKAVGDDLTGYETMEKAETFAEKNKDMYVIGVDDDHFASSNLCLIPHESKKYGYMGTWRS